MNHSVLLLSCVVALCSCRRESEQLCRHELTKRNVEVFFVGFTAAELDTVEGVRFTDETFSQALDSTTLTYPPFFAGDTAYAVSFGRSYSTLNPDRPGEIRIPSAGKTFRIRRLLYPNGDSGYFEYLSTDGCGSGRTFVTDANRVVVNGDTVAIRPSDFGGDLFLRK